MRSFLLHSLCHSVALASLSFSCDDFVIVPLAQPPLAISAICCLSSALVHLLFQGLSSWTSAFLSKFFVLSVLRGGQTLSPKCHYHITLYNHTHLGNQYPSLGEDTILCVCKYAHVCVQTHVCVDVYGQRSTWAVFLSRCLVSRNRGSHWFSQMRSGAPLCLVLLYVWCWGLNSGLHACMASSSPTNSPGP